MSAHVQHTTPWPRDLTTRSRPAVSTSPTSRPVPARQAAVDKPALAGGERILATDAGGHVVATDLALYRQEEGGWIRLGWERIERAHWDKDRHRLLLIGWSSDQPPTTLQLPARSPLVALARERIGWTTLLTTRVTLANLGEAVVTVRRDPADGALLWVVRPHPSVDITDPRLAGSIDTTIRWLRAHMGPADR